MESRPTARDMLAQERRDLVDFLCDLDADDWDRPSLCVGWRVRDVVAHLLYDAQSPAHYLMGAVRAGLRTDAVNDRFVGQAAALAPEQLVDRLEESIDSGLFSMVAASIALADTLVHHQDIRRPLGCPRVIPADRMRAVLDRPDPFASPWRYTRGLRFVASDLDWSKGRGPVVRGPGEALALAATGRAAVLEELAGEGVSLLAERLARS